MHALLLCAQMDQLAASGEARDEAEAHIQTLETEAQRLRSQLLPVEQQADEQVRGGGQSWHIHVSGI